MIIKKDKVQITISDTPKEIGRKAGKYAGELIRNAIQKNGSANIILATGESQFETLNQLLEEKDIDWKKVVVFHLDEYIGIPLTHKASFRKYLKERFIQKVAVLKDYFLINGEVNPEEECKRLGAIISNHPIDVALVGIGENGHLAFNDPPADFETETPYIVVVLDTSCREQQLNEGWFSTIEEVPKTAISMSVNQIMKSKHILCSVPGERKANAVKECLENEVTNVHPASILRQHPSCQIYLDLDSSKVLLSKESGN